MNYCQGRIGGCAGIAADLNHDRKRAMAANCSRTGGSIGSLIAVAGNINVELVDPHIPRRKAGEQDIVETETDLHAQERAARIYVGANHGERTCGAGLSGKACTDTSDA